MFRHVAVVAGLLVALSPALPAKDRLPRELTALTGPEIGQLNAALARQPADTYDTPPQVVEAFVPIYPASRLLARKSGSCRVSFRIGIDGRAHDATPDADADPKMCAHALFALQYWRFEPATRGGEAVSSRFRMPFNYDIMN